MEEKTDHDRIVEMHSFLLGANGQGGLARQVERNAKAIFKLWLCVVCIMVSVGGGTFGVIKVFGG